MDQLPRLAKRELICLLLFTCYCVVSVRRGVIFLWVLGMGCVNSLRHSLSIPYNYLVNACFLFRYLIAFLQWGRAIQVLTTLVPNTFCIYTIQYTTANMAYINKL